MAIDLHTVKIEKLVQGGRGLARLDGRVLLVRGAIPGEQVTLRPGRQHKGVQEAAIEQVVAASPDRVAAPCPVYERCGGCHLQHLRYEAQLAQKAAILKETLARLGKIDVGEIPPVVPSPEPYGYRSHVRFTVFSGGEGQGQGQGKSLALGFYQEGSHRPVPAAGCLLMSEPMRQAAAWLEARLREAPRLSLRLETVELRWSTAFGSFLLIHHTGPASQGEAQQLFSLFTELPGLVGQVAMARNRKRWVSGQDWIADRLDDLIFRISDRSFMQSNWRLAEELARTVVRWLGPLKERRILELYAGIGILGLPLARAGALVTEVEASPEALADCRHAAKVNHIGRCRFRALTAEAMLKEVEPDAYDLILLDPPRTGLSQDCAAELNRVKAPRLLYLSCDPATLARDLGRLRQAGYSLGRLQPFDMFPQTAHLETLVELVR